MCDNLSVCVKFAYVDAMLYLCMQYFMLYRFCVYGICSFGADLCVRNFFCVKCISAFNKLHFGTGKLCHLPNCNAVVIGLVICDYVRGIPTLRHHRVIATCSSDIRLH
jgi:hypothetical protein